MIKEVMDKVKRIRLERNLTQENMAMELNITYGAYSKIERGKVNITLKRLFRIAEILKISVTDLLEEKSRKQETFQEDLPAYLLATKNEFQDFRNEIIRELRQIRQRGQNRKNNSGGGSEL